MREKKNKKNQLNMRIGGYRWNNKTIKKTYRKYFKRHTIGN